MSQTKLLVALLLLGLSVSASMAQTERFQAGPEAQSAIERGNRSVAKADYESALRAYRSVPPGAGESYAQALYNIGVCYYELWRTTEAIDFYRQALKERQGRYPRASYALGVALEDRGQSEEAKEAFRQSIIASQGEYALAHYRLGLLLAGDGDYEGAAACFGKAIARAGEHIPASHNNLGVMLARQGRLKEAEREFEIALRQTRGRFDDASHNLKLCRSLLTTAATAQNARLRISGLIAAALK